MTSINADNPLTRVYDAIWDLFTGVTEFSEFFNVGNIIDFSDESTRDPLKINAATEDMPECILVPENMTPNLFDSSSSTKIIQNYAFIIHTGDLRLHAYILKINWIALVALKNWKTTLGQLQWKGENFVKVVRIQDSTIGRTEGERERRINGWSSIFRVSVEMHLKTENIVVTET